MGMEAIERVFPRRPLRLTKRGGRIATHILFALIVAALIAPALYWPLSAYRTLADRADLRARGIPAEVLTSEGDCYGSRDRISRRVTATGCELDIAYRVRPEAGGQVHHARVHLSGAAPAFAPPALYDPQDPDRAMLQSEVEGGPPWTTIAVAGLLWLFAAIMAGCWPLATQRGIGAAARSARPIAVPLSRTIRSMPSNVTHVYFECPDGRSASDAFLGELPFMLPTPAGADPARQWALAIQGRRGRPYLLDEGLQLLDFTDQERAAIRAAATR